jgi:hypothetical protein
MPEQFLDRANVRTRFSADTIMLGADPGSDDVQETRTLGQDSLPSMENDVFLQKQPTILSISADYMPFLGRLIRPVETSKFL